MSIAAREFLDAWTIQAEQHPPLDDTDAAQLAAQWETDATENGIAVEDLRAAADGDVAAFLQRTFGRAGSELQLD